MSTMKNNPLLFAVLGVAAWYVLTQRNAAAGTIGGMRPAVGNPIYGQNGALINPTVRGYQVPPQQLPAAQKTNLATAALNLGAALLGRKPAPEVVYGAPGGSLLAGYSFGGLNSSGLGVDPQILTGMLAGPNSLAAPQLIGDYGWSDGQGIIDSYIGSAAPELAWPQEADADPLGYF